MGSSPFCTFTVIASAAKQSIVRQGRVDCFVAALLAMTTAVATSIQLLDRHRDALADADAHGGERAFSAALLHAVHRRQCEPRAAHAKGMTERDGAAMRVDEIGIVL